MNIEEELKKIKDKNNNIWIWNKEKFIYELENKAWCFLGFRSDEFSLEVEIIEDKEEIDIQNIQIIRDYRTSDDDLYNDNFEDFRGTINDLVYAIKQLDNNIKEIKKNG